MKPQALIVRTVIEQVIVWVEQQKGCISCVIWYTDNIILNKLITCYIQATQGVFHPTCPGLDGVWWLAPSSWVDRHDAQNVVRIRLEAYHGPRGLCYRCLKEEISCCWLGPQDVAGCPRNLCKLNSDAVAVFGVGLVNARDVRSWRLNDKSKTEAQTKSHQNLTKGMHSFAAQKDKHYSIKHTHFVSTMFFISFVSFTTQNVTNLWCTVYLNV